MKKCRRQIFSLVLNAEARYAAQQMEQELNIPFIELARVFQADKISTQYRLLGQAIGAELCDKEYYEQTMALIDDFRESIKGCALQWASFQTATP